MFSFKFTFFLVLENFVCESHIYIFPLLSLPSPSPPVFLLYSFKLWKMHGWMVRTRGSGYLTLKYCWSEWWGHFQNELVAVMTAFPRPAHDQISPNSSVYKGRKGSWSHTLNWGLIEKVSLLRSPESRVYIYLILVFLVSILNSLNLLKTSLLNTLFHLCQFNIYVITDKSLNFFESQSSYHSPWLWGFMSSCTQGARKSTWCIVHSKKVAAVFIPLRAASSCLCLESGEYVG